MVEEEYSERARARDSVILRISGRVRLVRRERMAWSERMVSGMMVDGMGWAARPGGG